MTLSSASVSLVSLTKSPDKTSLLLALKDLKNAVIGNTWKKVEVTTDEGLKDFLIQQLASRQLSDQVDLDIITETCVVLGALASDGPLTLQPLIVAHVPASLLELTRSVLCTNLSKSQEGKVLPSVLRALRNILVSAADAIWGNMWGVGAERKVVGTGLVGQETGEIEGKGKNAASRDDVWRYEATQALTSVFEIANLTTLLSVLRTHEHPQITLPVYQLLSRLIVLPSHRQALARWQPAPPDLGHPAHAGPSGMRRIDPAATRSFGSSSLSADLPFILQHLIDSIVNSERGTRKVTPKALEAALELLAALAKGQPAVTGLLRNWSSSDQEMRLLDEVPMSPGSPFATMRSPTLEKEPRLPELFSILLNILATGGTSVRIASASCLATLLKAEKHPRPTSYTRIHLQLLGSVTELLRTESSDDKVKLCFVIATIVADEAGLAKVAGDEGCPQQIIQLLDSIEKDDEKGEISRDLASRGREGTLLALAALSFPLDSIRVVVTESDPSCLPHLLRALSHESYGVRAAACQLARALTRTVSLVRTSLTDSGIADAVVALLIREVSDRRHRHLSRQEESPNIEQGVGESWDNRLRTVEVTAMMTLSNLIADFSPLKETILNGPAINTICDLTYAPQESIALNALWTIKNAMFKSSDTAKARILVALGIEHLRSLLAASNPSTIRVQAFRIVQNYLADGSASDLSKGVDLLGEGRLLDEVAGALREGNDLELRSAAFGVLINLSWGNERLRQAITGRHELVESLSRGLDDKYDDIKHSALKSLQNLITSTVKSSRPRQAMLDVFQPYHLKPRVKELLETSPGLEVATAATGLYEVLDKARGGNEMILREDVLDR